MHSVSLFSAIVVTSRFAVIRHPPIFTSLLSQLRLGSCVTAFFFSVLRDSTTKLSTVCIHRSGQEYRRQYETIFSSLPIVRERKCTGWGRKRDRKSVV